MKEKILTEWNFDDLYDRKDPDFLKEREARKKATELFVKKWKADKSYLTDSKTMLRALDEYEQWNARWGTSNEFYYYWLKNELDNSNTELKAKLLKVQEFTQLEITEHMRFFELSFKEISESKQKEFLSSKELEKYRHYLQRIFEMNRYTLSEREEKIMGLKSNPAHGAWVNMVSEFLSDEERIILGADGKEEKKNFSQITSLLADTNKKVRDKAAEAFNEILAKHNSVAEAEMNAILANAESTREIRKYKYPSQERHIQDNVSPAMIDSLKKAVQAHYGLTHRYYALKAKLLGQKKLAYHERSVPYGKSETNYSYEDAYKLVHKVISELDDEFKEALDDLSSNGRIDAFPKKGKSGGAFCVYMAKLQPTYVLLNLLGKLRDVTTLAHELGHAINDELMRKKQHSLYFETSTATAEVASTFMEGFVFRELLKGADDNLRLALLMERLGDDLSTIIRQTACYAFEEELHALHKEKGYLSKKEIGDLFQKHMSAYMGPAVEQSKGSENWWVYWSHLRRFFYTYSYSSGQLISKALQRKVHKDPSFIKEVKEFLYAGTSKSPKDTFLAMGIDIEKISFWEEGLKEVEEQLNEAEKLAKKLKKI